VRHVTSCPIVRSAGPRAVADALHIWLFDIAKGVYAFVVYGEADDHRSDEEDDDEEEDSDETAKKES